MRHAVSGPEANSCKCSARVREEPHERSWFQFEAHLPLRHAKQKGRPRLKHAVAPRISHSRHPAAEKTSPNWELTAAAHPVRQTISLLRPAIYKIKDPPVRPALFPYTTRVR